jgi:hypothetical protein
MPSMSCQVGVALVVYLLYSFSYKDDSDSTLLYPLLQRIAHYQAIFLHSHFLVKLSWSLYNIPFIYIKALTTRFSFSKSSSWRHFSRLLLF